MIYDRPNARQKNVPSILFYNTDPLTGCATGDCLDNIEKIVDFGTILSKHSCFVEKPQKSRQQALIDLIVERLQKFEERRVRANPGIKDKHVVVEEGIGFGTDDVLRVEKRL